MGNEQLTGRTVASHLNLIGRFYEEFDWREVTQKEVQEYLMKLGNKNTYRNNLSTLRVFFRDFKQVRWLVEGFRFPRVMLLPKAIPRRQALQDFYTASDDLRDRAIFLMFASSGLRRQELLGLRMGEIDLEKRMLTPKTKGMTKLAWVSFYNEEAEGLLRKYLGQRRAGSGRLFVHKEADLKKIWIGAMEKTGLEITPQVLREWFAEEMSNLGVPERYIDAFCGRIPRSVLAKHYTNYRPETLRQAYEKAGLRVRG